MGEVGNQVESIGRPHISTPLERYGHEAVDIDPAQYQWAFLLGYGSPLIILGFILALLLGMAGFFIAGFIKKAKRFEIWKWAIGCGLTAIVVYIFSLLLMNPILSLIFCPAHYQFQSAGAIDALAHCDKVNE